MKCIVLDDDKVSRLLIEKYIKKTNFLDLLGSFSSAIDALNFEDIQEADLVFVDIEMPEMSGLEFMKSFKNMPLVIIISAKDKYAIEALDLDAVDYLLKPIEFSRFHKAANKAKYIFHSTIKKEQRGIFIRDGNTNLIRLKFETIIWIEALENYVLIVTEYERHTVYFTMKALENQLPENKFVRIHRSFIINMDKIIKIEDNFVKIKYLEKEKNKEKEIVKEIPLAKTMKKNIIEKIKIISK